MKKTPFGQLPLVTVGTFHVCRVGETEARLRFENEWNNDKTVMVRRFKRDVRAGGTSDTVFVVVVRRKEIQS